ncbi:MAG: endonuclease III [Epsilonproteobacteria bacterium]|nr:endonuclease III [Campylobacterota bacterium]
MDLARLEMVVAILSQEMGGWKVPAAQGCFPGSDPYRILVGAILSSRTKDTIACPAARRLFQRVDGLQEMVALGALEIAKTIYPVGFYHQKGRWIEAASRQLVEEHGGRVPDRLEQLLQLEGVGVKVAKIVLERAFGQAVVAVDTHVHRILNRWGFLTTATPNQTDRLLQEVLPETLARGLNRTLVAFGQAICHPRDPKCWSCPVRQYVRCST